MNKIPLSILTLSALSLVGCGGGEGGSSTPVANYTFSFVALYETERNTLPAECAIFDSQPIYKESSNSDEKEIDKYKLILAARSQTSNITVLVQDKTGRVIDEYSPRSANSSVSFPQSEVPRDGYITIAYQTVRSGSDTVIVDGVTYHKSLLSNNMQFSSALSRPVSESLSACITQTRTRFSQRKQSIDDGGDARGVFAFNTPEQNYWALSPLNVELETSGKPVLAVRYQSLSTDNPSNINSAFSQAQYRPLEAYKMVTTRELGSKPIELNPIGDKANDNFPLWTHSDTTAPLTSAQLLIRHNNQPYLWQSLPTTGSTTFSYASEFARNYVLKAQGTNQGWSFVHNTRLGGNDSWNPRPQDGINYNFVVNDLAKPASSPVQIEGCGRDCETGKQLRTYLGTPDKQFTIQRSFILVEDGPGRQIRQVIYTPPMQQVILPSYASGAVDGLWHSNIKLAQVDLLQGNRTVRNAFMRQFNDPQKEVKGAFELEPSIDGLGLMTTLETRQKDASAIGVENYFWLTK
ncbi:hypothetical protein [Vibrio metschnikovii]|uniref:hypothetical protein n=1 Tax=Vibrio metschnikovii TaxID=28172 RepID=UPI0029781952|nr:hypothetical protein [Vibrio metschnikovii]EKO3659861.1 hypothetical protein [Vibrio metschnikovii]EKO3677087.1 hypothetical protein [Vibrio metschnikovii]